MSSRDARCIRGRGAEKQKFEGHDDCATATAFPLDVGTAVLGRRGADSSDHDARQSTIMKFLDIATEMSRMLLTVLRSLSNTPVSPIFYTFSCSIPRSESCLPWS
jgi:hypothetical protein